MPRKVLLVRFSSLGDVVLTSALLEPLFRNSFEVHLLTFEPYGGLFIDDRRVKVIETSREELRKNLKGLIERLNAEGYYALIDLHANLRSLLIRRKTAAEVKAAYDKRALFRRVCVLLNRLGFGKLKEKPFSVVEAYAKTLKVLGIEEKHPRPKIEINKSAAEELLKQYDLKRGEFVVLGIGARYPKKAYPHFEELSKLLLKEGYKVVLVGDRADYERSKHWKGVINLCGKLSLIESLRLLSAARLFVGNDSGATHMARAVKTPVITIFGGTHPCLGFAPHPDEGLVLTKNLPCSPCDLHGKGDCPKNFECLDLPPTEIFQKIKEIPALRAGF